MSVISKVMEESLLIKTIVLYTCDITSRGTDDLSKGLARNSSLERLDIGDNNIEDEGITYNHEKEPG